MAFCINCGKQINGEHKFCLYCGAAQPSGSNATVASVDGSVKAPEAPAYEAPAFEAPQTPVTPAYEAPAFEAPQTPVTPAYEAPAYEAPAFEAPQAQAAPAYEAPQAPAYVAPADHAYQNYATVEESNKAKKSGGSAKVFGIISFAVGITSTVLCCSVSSVTASAYTTLIFGAVAAIFGIISLIKGRNTKSNKVFAIIGLVLGGLTLLVSFFAFMMLIAFGGEQGLIDYITSNMPTDFE